MYRTQTRTSARREAGLKVCRLTSRMTGRPRSRHLLDCWPQVEKRLQAAKRVALFLDFDGTLTALRRRPQDVWLDSSTRRLLRRLARHPNLSVVLISGRERRDLIKRIRVPGVQYLGLHGLERGGRVPPRSPTYEILRRAKRSLAGLMVDLPDVWIEDKRLALAVHYRDATAGTVQQARRIVQETLGHPVLALRVLRGKKVLEVLLQDAPDKGDAVVEILKELPADTLPIYLGDDTTDESAFAVLRKGVTVRVGVLRGSKARYRLRNPAEVKKFLERLEVEIL